jgi:hypothetical protein
LNEDGSGVIECGEKREELPAGSLETYNNMLKITLNNSEIFYGMEYITGIVYHNGEKLALDYEYVLQTVYEAENGCAHVHAEIRDRDVANRYAGQVWCLDCGEMFMDLGIIEVPT